MDITRHGWQRDRHLAEADAQAYFDGELEWGRSLEHTIHLRHCELCRRALNAVRARADRVAGLLRLVLVQPVRSAS
jgi:anti-sigma factor RsiW